MYWKMLIVHSYKQQTILCVFMQQNTIHGYFYLFLYIYIYKNMNEKKTQKSSCSDGVK